MSWEDLGSITIDEIYTLGVSADGGRLNLCFEDDDPPRSIDLNPRNARELVSLIEKWLEGQKP